MRKIKAIKYLIENGSRASEWQEAGLLQEIEKIVNKEEKDLSKENLDRMIENAKNF